MIRVLSILAAVVALAVSAQPAWAAPSKPATAQGVMLLHGDFSSVHYNGHAGLGANASAKAIRGDAQDTQTAVANHTSGAVSLRLAEEMTEALHA